MLTKLRESRLPKLLSRILNSKKIAIEKKVEPGKSEPIDSNSFPDAVWHRNRSARYRRY